MKEFKNPLARGFYSVSDAARLIEVGSAQRIRGWLQGYTRSDVGPLLQRDYEPIANIQELSFYDLMEVRFVEHFRNAGVRVQTLRQALESARRIFGVPKPMLRQDILFIPTTDKRKLIVEEVFKPAAEANKDKKLWDLVNRNYEFDGFIENKLARGLAFDAGTHLISQWAPRAHDFPEITIDPAVAYGRPTIPEKIPSVTIYDMWKAEDEDLGAVADWFDIPIDHADMAVGFEKLLLQEGRRLAT